MRLTVMAALFGAATAICAPSVTAAPLLGSGGGSCTGINCASTRFVGVIANEAGFAVPFTIQLQVSTGFCLRLETIAQDTDLEMVVVTPDGTTYRDDDGGAGNLSLVKIASNADPGFVTVHLSRFDGVAANAAFTLLSGQYPVGNPNCASPTPPMAARGAALAKD